MSQGPANEVATPQVIKVPSDPLWWQDPARITLLILGVSVCVLAAILFPYERGSLVLGVGIFCLVATLFGYEWTCYALWMIFPVSWLIHPSDTSDVLEVSDLVCCVLYLLLTGVLFRYLEIKRFAKSVFYRPSSAEKNTWKFPSLLGGRWWMILLALSTAWMVLTWFPLDGRSPLKYTLKPIHARVIILVGGLFFLWFICRSMIQLISRWMMTPQQADVYRRSMVAREYWRDQSRIEKKRATYLSDHIEEE